MPTLFEEHSVRSIKIYAYKPVIFFKSSLFGFYCAFNTLNNLGESMEITGSIEVAHFVCREKDLLFSAFFGPKACHTEDELCP